MGEGEHYAVGITQLLLPSKQYVYQPNTIKITITHGRKDDEA